MHQAFSNLGSEYQQVCQQIFALLGRAKELRLRSDGNGYTNPSEGSGGTGPGLALAAVTFPLLGTLAHVETADQYLALIAGLEKLETSMGEVVSFKKADGTTGQTIPGAALAQFRG